MSAKNSRVTPKFVDVFEETCRYMAQTQATLFLLISGDQNKRLDNDDVSGCLWIIEEQLERIKVNHDTLWSEIFKGGKNEQR